MNYAIVSLILFILSCILAFRLRAVTKRHRVYENDTLSCIAPQGIEAENEKTIDFYTKRNNMIAKVCGIDLWEYDIESNAFVGYNHSDHRDKGTLAANQLVNYIHPDEKQKLEQMLTHMNNRDCKEIEIELRYKFPSDEDYNWFIVNGIAVEDEEGRIVKYTGMRRSTHKWHQIISELETKNEELSTTKKDIEDSNLLFRTVIDRFPYCLYIKDIDNDLKYLIANKTFCSTIGLSEKEIIGKNDYELFGPTEADAYHENDMKAVESNSKTSIEEHTNHQGKGRFWQTTKSHVTLSDGRRLLECLSIDITESNNNLLALNNEKLKAETSDKLKSAFLANMSHEIRTPLNAIVGFSELLTDTDDSDEKKSYIEIIKLNNELLLKLISDILDLSKIESGVVELKYERFDLSQHFDNLATSLAQRIQKNDVKFIVDNPYEMCMVDMDRSRISQIITNFVTNAIKFTDKGYIRMGYAVEGQGIRFYVSDTGIGIPKNKIEKVFNRFEKLNDHAQGSGLGMAISKAIVDVSKGKIGLESEEHKGSIFWAWIPSNTIEERQKIDYHPES